MTHQPSFPPPLTKLSNLSIETLAELAEVLGRAKFDRYLGLDERQQFMRLLGRIVDMPPLTHRFTDCRDPSDNKFLDLAASGQASVLITGDRDLLELHPFRGIPIITPASYLQSTPDP